MWKLVIEDDEGKRTVVPLTREDYSIGRQEGNTIRLTERNVSREHGRIRRTTRNGAGNGVKELFTLEDRQSYNGVFVNGLRVAHTQDLQHGDLIQIGDYRIVLQDESASAADTNPIPISATDFDAKATIPIATGMRGQTLTERPSRFVMLVGPTPGVEYPLDRERLTIGRAEDATISVNHNSVSRLHCEVHALGDGRFEIVDKGSSNGVRVNAVELRRSIIEAGDVIELGDVRFKFVGAGQIFVAGPNESQQLTAISDREAELVDPNRRSWGGYTLPIVGAGLFGAAIILAFVYVVRSHATTEPQTNTTVVPSADPAHSLVIDAKKNCTPEDCEAPHMQVSTQLPAQSPWRDSPEFHYIETTWADSILKKAANETDLATRRLQYYRVANTPSIDEARRKQAADALTALEDPMPVATPVSLKDAGASTTTLLAGTAPTSTPPAPTPKPTHTAAPQTGPTATPTQAPAPTATPATTPSTSASKPSAAALEKARTAALEGRPGEVRSLLETRVRSGHATPEEVRLVRGACQAQGDMACIDDIKKKY